eukprot:m.255214 g.255214  ORF g.255214 m.255214 type:complete len:484 (-) comp19612_c0_seq1:225-1676(-)
MSKYETIIENLTHRDVTNIMGTRFFCIAVFYVTFTGACVSSKAITLPPEDTTPDGFSRFLLLSAATSACHVSEYGAAGDNRSDDTTAIQAAIDACCRKNPEDAVVVFESQRTYKVTSSIALASNTTILLGINTTIFSAVTPADPIRQNPRCPTLYWSQGPTAILCGSNLSNVAVLGVDETSSLIDGGGWPWYAAGLRNASMQGRGPRTFEVAWSSNVTLSRVGFHNSPAWTVHPTFCTGVVAEHIQIHNPRFTPNTDGFDPDSCTDVVLRDSVIDTGDDGISIKSGNSTEPGSSHIQCPARNIHIYRVTVLSRNFCVGSATYGGVYDLVMEDCAIGDDNGSSPWAIKYKSHQSYPGTMRNHTFRRLRVGNIQPNSYQQPRAGYFMSIELRYHALIPNRTCLSWDCPLFADVSFEDIVITGAARAGDINGFKGDLLQGLRFSNVSFVNTPALGWKCGYVNTSSFSAIDVRPPLACNEGPSANRI